jgi:hypothetical protein
MKGIPKRLVDSRRLRIRKKAHRSSTPVSSSTTLILIKNGDIVVVENTIRNITQTNDKDRRRVTSQNAAAIPMTSVNRDAKVSVSVVLETDRPRKNTISSALRSKGSNCVDGFFRGFIFRQINKHQ